MAFTENDELHHLIRLNRGIEPIRNSSNISSNDYSTCMWGRTERGWGSLRIWSMNDEFTRQFYEHRGNYALTLVFNFREDDEEKRLLYLARQRLLWLTVIL